MRIFQTKTPDKQGTIDWQLTHSIALFRQVKALLQIDLLTPDAPADQPAALRLSQDLEVFVNALYACVKEQADAAGITDEQFGMLLEDAAFVAARKAFWEEWEDFFVRTGAMAKAAQLRKQLEIFAAAAQRLAGIPVEKFLGPIDAAIEQGLSIAGPTSMKSPAF